MVQLRIKRCFSTYPVSHASHPYGATQIGTSKISIILGWMRRGLGSSLLLRLVPSLPRPSLPTNPPFPEPKMLLFNPPTTLFPSLPWPPQTRANSLAHAWNWYRVADAHPRTSPSTSRIVIKVLYGTFMTLRQGKGLALAKHTIWIALHVVEIFIRES